jgi:membrane peptidoglycan carboxypeptidase
MTFEDVIVKSSNVGAIKAGLGVGGDRLREYVERFGFGQSIARQMPGQSPGLWSRASMTESRIASISMGYEIGVTPLQMATAASAVANGGRLLEPYVVRARVRNGRREEFVPKVVRQVIRPATAATLSRIMEGVVERGTAKAARLTGYRVAGKTGTAKKAVAGGYSQTDFNASFVGFLPARNPAFTILVVIDTPRNGTYYGGSVAAPIFQKIAEAAVQYAGLAPTEDTRPSLLDRGVPPNTAIQRTMAVNAPAPALVFAGGPGLMPDLTGLAAREAVQVMTGLGLVVRVEGAGFVTRQRPAPGAVVESGSLGSLELNRTNTEGARR